MRLWRPWLYWSVLVLEQAMYGLDTWQPPCGASPLKWARRELVSAAVSWIPAGAMNPLLGLLCLTGRVANMERQGCSATSPQLWVFFHTPLQLFLLNGLAESTNWKYLLFIRMYTIKIRVDWDYKYPKKSPWKSNFHLKVSPLVGPFSPYYITIKYLKYHDFPERCYKTSKL